MRDISRVGAALVLLALAGLCAFGFLATFEHTSARARAPWQIGYSIGGLLCGGGAMLLLFARRDRE